MAEPSNKIAVALSDGRVAEFTPKQKIIKTTTIDEATNSVTTVFDFRNGATRSFTSPASLILKFAGHGIEQKIGDSIAGEDDMDDAVAGVDDLIARLSKGEWTAPRKAGAFTGVSILLRALVEASGQTVEFVKNFLDAKTPQEKTAMRKAPGVAEIVARLEAEKAANSKKPSVDTASLLGGLGIGATATSGAADEDLSDPAAAVTSRKR